MTSDKELMQQALDALEVEHSAIYGKSQTARAIETLRARLAQPEQEPLWIRNEEGKLELHALAQREWQILTDEEMFSLWVKCPAETEDRFAFARAIEAKLKEKNT